jgi:predicted phosphodiesterase
VSRLKLITGVAIAAYFVAAGWVYFSQTRAVKPAHQDELPVVEKKERLRIILIGDTGMPGALRDGVRRQVLAESKDAIIALGDLIYPHPPPCPTGAIDAKDLPFYEQRVAHGLEGLRAPVYAILGNHSYYRGKRSLVSRIFPFVPSTLEAGDPGDGRIVDPAACMVDFIGMRPQIHLPSLDYGLDFGVAQIAFVDTDHLDERATKVVDTTFATGSGWKLLMGHHVLKTYHNKERENYVAPWLKSLKAQPDLYANGHAHFLQFGIYGGVPAVTSGSGSKLRHRPACPPDCGEGQLFGVSTAGYAVLEVAPKELTVIFKDDVGAERYRWSAKR